MNTSSSYTFNPPNFSNGLDTPEYKSILNEGNIEIREYKESFWVTTEDLNSQSGFWKLFNYISGENSSQEKINMTTPVLRNISFKNSSGTMSFYLGKKFQNGIVPKPNGENAFIEKIPFKKVALIVYDGYTNKEKEYEKLKILGDFLTMRNIKFSSENYFFAGYDAPYKTSNRHNEVWVELF
jgi:hypothetical protein